MAAKTSWRRYGTKLRHCHLCIRLCLISEQNFRMHLANSVILKPRYSLRNASENSKTTNSFILINEFYKIMQRNKHVNSVIRVVDILNLIQTASRSMQPFQHSSRLQSTNRHTDRRTNKHTDHRRSVYNIGGIQCQRCGIIIKWYFGARIAQFAVVVERTSTHLEVDGGCYGITLVRQVVLLGSTSPCAAPRRRKPAKT